MVAVGDWVEISPQPGGEGMIEGVEPRHRLLSRMAPTPQGEYQQIIIANPDQMVFIFACARPEPHLGMLDRLLVMAEKQGIPALVVANKVDLVEAPRQWHCFLVMNTWDIRSFTLQQKADLGS